MEVWLLADYCEWIGTDPSRRLQLRRMGIAEVVCNDFDYAVRALKRVWDKRRDETVMVIDTSPKHAKPRVPAPKYKTLYEILGLQKDGTKPVKMDPGAQDREAELASQLIAGSVDWSQFNIA